jgi:predicted dehydrogenase
MSDFTPLPNPVRAARRRRYAIVGLGSRRELYQDAIEGVHAAQAELVAVCDPNPGRIELARARSARRGAAVPPGYLAADFDRMLRECRPEVVIVTTVDATHHDYLVRAMAAGCDVITEKPMTTDAARCRQILDTVRRTGRRCRVTFNYRYSPPRAHVKDLLMRGEIGDVLSVDFHWLLNTAPRRRLLPPLARSQKKFRRPVGAQGHAPLRPRELVARRRARIRFRHRQTRVLHARDGPPPRPCRPPRTLPHLPRKIPLRLLRRPRAQRPG